MRTVAFSAATLAAFLLGLPDDASAAGRGGRGFGHSGRSFSHSGPHVHGGFHGGARTRVFIGAPILAAPLLLYPGAAYYTPAPIYYTPPVYQEREPYINPDPAGQSWYYCPVAGAYYPYVGECPGGWQRVVPNNVPPPPAG